MWVSGKREGLCCGNRENGYLGGGSGHRMGLKEDLGLSGGVDLGRG